MPSSFRVIVQNVDTAAGRGPGTVAAIIDDAKDIGASEQVNGSGEFFMTLPMWHPQISSVVPLTTHYNVQRWNGSSYTSIFRGVIDEYEATRDEVVFFGRDWLSLFDTSISGANTSYVSNWVGNIVNHQLTQALVQPNSRVGFISKGTINLTSTTTIALTSFQSRLEFVSQLADISMADRTVRSIVQVSPRSSDAPSVNFTENQGSDTGIRLEYGGNVDDFFYSPGYSTLATGVYAIGQKREGATVLFTAQTYAPATTYGAIQRPALYIDVVDQGALDDRAAREARAAGRVGKTVGLGIANGALAPWAGYDLGDSMRVIIDRGIVNLNALYTVWGVEWIGRKNGSEELVLSLLPKDE